jgi:hypothetical protein
MAKFTIIIIRINELRFYFGSAESMAFLTQRKP